jgi:hypothetical protein
MPNPNTPDTTRDTLRDLLESAQTANQLTWSYLEEVATLGSSLLGVWASATRQSQAIGFDLARASLRASETWARSS